MPELLELQRGRTYRGKKPACVRSCGLVNDRTVIYISVDEVQYDGPSVAPGRHYPRAARRIRILATSQADKIGGSRPARFKSVSDPRRLAERPKLIMTNSLGRVCKG